jgi:single-strand DNA-binding protein
MTPGLRLLQLNDIRLVGRLTRDPEVRYTPKGVAVAKIDIAVNRRFKDTLGEWREEATFVPVTVWREAAERCREKLKKGSPIYVEGRLRSTSWETKDGQKRSGLEVEAYRLQFLAKTGEEGGDSAGGEATEPAASAAPMAGASASSSGGDEEIPF